MLNKFACFVAVLTVFSIFNISSGSAQVTKEITRYEVYDGQFQKLSRPRHVGEIKIGESVYVVPYAMHCQPKIGCQLNLNSGTIMKPMGDATLKVQKTKYGFVAFPTSSDWMSYYFHKLPKPGAEYLAPLQIRKK